MILYIKKQWLRKIKTLIFIITGFVIGNLVLSGGISISQETVTRQRDLTAGDPYIQTKINLENTEGLDFLNVLHFCEKLSDYGELQVINAGKVNIDVLNKKYPAYPVLFSKEEDWHIPLIEGRYFKPEETREKQSVIIGKNIAEKCGLHSGDRISIDTGEYEIMGISGRKNQEMVWDDIVCISWGTFKAYGSSLQDKTGVYALLKNGKDKVAANYDRDQEAGKKLGIDYTYEDLSQTMQGVEEHNNSVSITVIASVLIFVIVIVNITNLMMYWIIDRKRDLAVFKALGATDRYLLLCNMAEVVAMTVIGAAFALGLQYLLQAALGEILNRQEIYLDVSLTNLWICMLVTMICGMLASLIPAGIILKIQPAQSIKE